MHTSMYILIFREHSYSIYHVIINLLCNDDWILLPLKSFTIN